MTSKATRFRRPAKYGEARDFLVLASACTSDECLAWPFGMGDVGYGRVSWGGRQHSASTVVCEIKCGPKPSPRHLAAHSCGDRLCVNGSHLFWKTHAENSADMVKHGRSRRGHRQAGPRLSAEQVRRIKTSDDKASDLARLFGVPRYAIWSVRAGRTYNSVR